MITEDDITKWFSNHPLTVEQRQAVTKIRALAEEFAITILDNTPSSADQSASIRCIREAVMWANASISYGRN